MPGSRWSLAVRKAAMIGGLTALICVGISVLVLITVRDRATAAVHDQVTSAAERMVVLAKEDRLPGVVPAEGVEAIQVLNGRGQVVASTPQLAGKAPMASFRQGHYSVVEVRDLCPPAGLHGCMTVAAIRFVKPDGVWVAYAAEPVPDVHRHAALLMSLDGTSVLLSVMAAAGTYRSVRRLLAPIEAIQAELADITADGFGRRVGVPATHEEIRRLAETVNSTLDRLEAALSRFRRFHLDVSHDLRTPIAAIRVELEEALMYPDETQWPHTAAKMMGEIERLQAVLSDLADLDTAGHGRPPQPRPARPR
jgi:methyl-accepting chemotaxis protein